MKKSLIGFLMVCSAAQLTAATTSSKALLKRFQDKQNEYIEKATQALKDNNFDDAQEATKKAKMTEEIITMIKEQQK
jgi:HPt (histidine-containing phosphotransfer) domain-containing protein